MPCSDGSITPSVGPVPHQASGSSSPCSHTSSGGSRHPVSALKKWLTNPVRKLSSDARGGAGKVEKQMYRSDGRQPPSLCSHGEAQPRPLEQHNNYTILPTGDQDMVRPRDFNLMYTFNLSEETLFMLVCDALLLKQLHRCGKTVCRGQHLLLLHSPLVRATHLTSCQAETHRV